jgi:hypothetical protein
LLGLTDTKLKNELTSLTNVDIWNAAVTESKVVERECLLNINDVSLRLKLSEAQQERELQTLSKLLVEEVSLHEQLQTAKNTLKAHQEKSIHALRNKYSFESSVDVDARSNEELKVIDRYQATEIESNRNTLLQIRENRILQISNDSKEYDSCTEKLKMLNTTVDSHVDNLKYLESKLAQTDQQILNHKSDVMQRLIGIQVKNSSNTSNVSFHSATDDITHVAAYTRNTLVSLQKELGDKMEQLTLIRMNMQSIRNNIAILNTSNHDGDHLDCPACGSAVPEGHFAARVISMNDEYEKSVTANKQCTLEIDNLQASIKQSSTLVMMCDNHIQLVSQRKNMENEIRDKIALIDTLNKEISTMKRKLEDIGAERKQKEALCEQEEALAEGCLNRAYDKLQTMKGDYNRLIALATEVSRIVGVVFLIEICYDFNIINR